LGTMQKEMANIRSGAYKTAQEIRGKAEATATAIYGKAFGQDPDFYAFFKTLESFTEQSEGKTELIMSTDSEYFRYLKKVPEK